MGEGDEPIVPGESDLIRRLRRRAEQLRAATEAEHAPPAADEPHTPEEPQPEEPETVEPAVREDPDADPFIGWADLSPTVDPDSVDILSQWADEEHVETESPARNWTPVVVAIATLVILGLVALGFRWATNGDDDDEAGGGRSEDDEATSVIDSDPPTLEDLTSEVTVPAGPAEGLTIADKGVTIVEDRFDAARREGTFGVVITNPHEGFLAQGVQIDVDLLDETGAAVGTDSAFLEIVLPGQTVAVGGLFFDAPTVPVVDLTVTLDVARWRETDGIEGGFTVGEPLTEEAEFSGVRTVFTLRSDFEAALTDTAVTAVYRAADGRIVGASDTFVELLDPGVDNEVEISLLANIPLDAIASTEIYPAPGFGFVPDQ